MSSRLLRSATRRLVRAYQPGRSPSRTVAIVVPLSRRSHLEATEVISLRHLVHHLGHYDKYALAPPRLAAPLDGFQIKRFPDKFFGSVAAHNNLLLTPAFYRAFEDYRFVLFYHLDSLVFSDQLQQWCETDLDYIGPPWIPCSDTPWVTRARVGNGGFTLLRVASALKVLHNRHRQEPSTLWLDWIARNSRRLGPLLRMLQGVSQRYPRCKPLQRIVRHWLKSENPGAHSRNNDMFWSDHAVRFLPEFKVASVEEGLRFAFEGAPRMCYELNQHRLPFGCHAWPRYDRSFWEPHLLKSEAETSGPRAVARADARLTKANE
jgi:hypothetical protein